MRLLSREELTQDYPLILKELRTKIFVYPTDTIYGLGCDATNKELVQKIRELKNSSLQPFSIIVPSKKWVYDNCEVTPEAEEWVEKLGGLAEINGQKTPFTLILKLKEPTAVAPNVTQGLKSIGVRMPDHWFSKIVEDLGVPVISTSANPTGGDFMTSIDNLDEKIKEGIDLCVYEGEKKGRPSTLVYLDKGGVSFKKR